MRGNEKGAPGARADGDIVYQGLSDVYQVGTGNRGSQAIAGDRGMMDDAHGQRGVAHVARPYRLFMEVK